MCRINSGDGGDGGHWGVTVVVMDIIAVGGGFDEGGVVMAVTQGLSDVSNTSCSL